MTELSRLKDSHFEGGSNIAKGGVKSKAKDLASLLNEIQANANILKFTSAAGSGGGATEGDQAVVGLKATDTILSVTQRVPGANTLAMIGYADQKDGSLDVVYAADPGAGAIVEVVVARPLV